MKTLEIIIRTLKGFEEDVIAKERMCEIIHTQKYSIYIGVCLQFLTQDSQNPCKSLSDKSSRSIFCSTEMTLCGLLGGTGNQ